MGDFGAKVSQKGNNIENCPDDKLLFSSGFQTLKVYKTGTITVNVGDSGKVTHNLGYYPAFLVYILNSDNTWEVSSYGTVDISNLNLFVPFVSPITYQYVIFLHDLNKNIDQTTLLASSSNTGTPDNSSKKTEDYGFKISKDSKDVSDTKEDMNITSGSKIHIIHKTGHGKSVINDISVPHDLGYIPMHLVYCKLDTEDYVRMNFAPAYEYSSSTLNEIKIHNNKLDILSANRWSSWNYHYIIFKDKI